MIFEKAPNIFSALLYGTLSTLVFLIVFPFYPFIISALIILVITLLAFFRRERTAFIVLTILLLPGIFLKFKQALLPAGLIAVLLLLIAKYFDEISTPIGVLAWVLALDPSLRYFAIPLLLAHAALASKGDRRIGAFKPLIVFTTLYTASLIAANAIMEVPWLGPIWLRQAPLERLSAEDITKAFMGYSIGLYASRDALNKIFSWSATYILPSLMALSSYASMAFAKRLRGLLPKRLIPFAITLSSFLSFIILTVILGVLMPYADLDKGLDFSVFSNGLPHAALLSILFVMPDYLRVVERKAVEEEIGEWFRVITDKGELERLAEDWDVLVGIDDVKREIETTVIQPLKNRNWAKRYGLPRPRGLLLFGPPGTGKTVLARAVAGRLKWSTIIVNVSDLLSKYYGESERRVFALFETARKYAPCVLIFDEIDALGKARTRYASDDVTPRLLNIILSEIDGIRKDDIDIFIIGTTNEPDLLDPALLRPGRFDKAIYVPPPDEKGREELFRRLLNGKPIEGHIDYAKLAKMTERFTGADIVNVVREAIVKAVKEGRGVRQDDLEAVIRSYRPSLTISLLEKYEAFKLKYSRLRRRPVIYGVPDVTWDSIGDLKVVKELIEKYIIRPIQDESLGIEPIKGVLLFGPPGVGKTLIAKATANLLNAVFLEINGAELARHGPERAAATVKEIFDLARENAPSLIFIDEIDAIAPPRDSPLGLTWGSVVSQLLVEMDGLKEAKKVVVIAATNRPWAIDPALLRPGRFDKLVYVPLPGIDARREILKIHMKGLDVDEDAIEYAAKATEGFSGADIAALAREVRMILIERGCKEGCKADKSLIEEALRRVRPSVSRDMLRAYEEFAKAFNAIICVG